MGKLPLFGKSFLFDFFVLVRSKMTRKHIWPEKMGSCMRKFGRSRPFFRNISFFSCALNRESTIVSDNILYSLFCRAFYADHFCLDSFHFLSKNDRDIVKILKALKLDKLSIYCYGVFSVLINFRDFSILTVSPSFFDKK